MSITLYYSGNGFTIKKMPVNFDTEIVGSLAYKQLLTATTYSDSNLTVPIGHAFYDETINIMSATENYASLLGYIYFDNSGNNVYPNSNPTNFIQFTIVTQNVSKPGFLPVGTYKYIVTGGAGSSNGSNDLYNYIGGRLDFVVGSTSAKLRTITINPP